MKNALLCLAAFFATTIITFSQTPEAPAEVVWAVKPLDLPVENFELVSADGRKITVTVLSRSRTGITIRNADGKELTIAYFDLDIPTRIKIQGTTGLPTTASKKETPIEFRRRCLEQATNNSRKLNSEANKWEVAIAEENLRIEEFEATKTKEELSTITKTILKLDAKTLQEKMRSKDMECRAITRYLVSNAEQELAKNLTEQEMRGMPMSMKNVKYGRTSADIFLGLDLNTNPLEELSLRPKFENLGVNGIEQTGPECALAATYNLARFAARAAGIEPKSKDALEAAYQANGYKKTQGAYVTAHLISSIEKTYGKRPTVQEVKGLPERARAEIVKHEIRMGRPVLAQITNGSTPHLVILTGFKPSNKTHQPIEWEYLDSNHIYKNGGYKTTLSAMPEYSIYFEKD